VGVARRRINESISFGSLSIFAWTVIPSHVSRRSDVTCSHGKAFRSTTEGEGAGWAWLASGGCDGIGRGDGSWGTGLAESTSGVRGEVTWLTLIARWTGI